MEDLAPDDLETPPPLPKGTYNFNFDDLDENTNPFQSGTKLGQSPPSSGHQQLETPHNNLNSLAGTNGSNNNEGEKFAGGEDKDPFKTKSSLNRSPTGSPKIVDNVDVIDPLKPKAKLARSPTPESETVPPADGERQEGMEENGSNMAAETPKKKAASPKKNIKRPKIRPKFKPPENLKNQGDEDDIQIFVPPPKQQNALSQPDTEMLPEPSSDQICMQTVPEPEQEQTLSEPVLVSEPEPEQTLSEPVLVPEPEPEQTLSEPVLVPEPDSLPQSAIQPSEGIYEDASETLPEPDTPSGNATSVKVNSQMTESLEPFHEFEAGEMPEDEANEGFVPASEVFSDPAAWEMLEKLSGDAESDLARQSLFVKFDPLVEGQKTAAGSDGSKGGDETQDSKERNDDDLLLMNTPPPAKSSGRVQKHPAVRALQDQVEGGGSPREAQEIDKMLAFTPVKGDKKSESGVPDGAIHSRLAGSPAKDNIVQLVQVLKYSQSDWNKMKQDLELDFQARMLNKEKEWSKKLADRDKKISNLDEQVKVLKQSNEDMRLVVTEFEKTIAQLQAEKEKTSTSSKDSLEEIERERDQAIEDLQSVESAFSDLHRRYEKTKGVVEGFKKNEEVLKKCVQDYQTKLQKAEESMQSIKDQAEEKLEQASLEMEKVRKSTSSDVARLEAALRKTELQVNGLQRGLETKTKENEELTAICDELIAKVGS